MVSNLLADAKSSEACIYCEVVWKKCSAVRFGRPWDSNDSKSTVNLKSDLIRWHSKRAVPGAKPVCLIDSQEPVLKWNRAE